MKPFSFPFLLTLFIVSLGCSGNSSKDTASSPASSKDPLEETEYYVPIGKDLKGQLSEACRTGNLAAVKGLVNEGVEINPPELFNTGLNSVNSPLIIATQNGSVEIVEFLIENGAVFHADRVNPGQLWGVRIKGPGETKWRLKVDPETRKTLEVLLQKASPGDGPDSSTGKPPSPSDILPRSVYLATKFGPLSDITAFLDGGGDIQARTAEGKTLLHGATKTGKVEIIQFLLERGANPNVPDQNGWTPIQNAIREHDFSSLRVLLKGGSNSDHQIQLSSAVRYAVGQGDTEAVRILLEGGGRANARNPNGETLLQLTKRLKNATEMKTLLIEFGASEQHSREWQELVSDLRLGKQQKALSFLREHSNAEELRELLFAAAATGNSIVVQYTLRKGMNASSIDDSGQTALHIAALYGQNDTLQILLDNGANPNFRSKDGATPLAVSARSGQVSAVERLLNSGADPNIPTLNGKSPYQLALSRIDHPGIKNPDDPLQKHSLQMAERKNLPYQRILKLLSSVATSEGIDPSTRYASEHLMKAAGEGDVEQLRALLEKSVDPNTTDEIGFTPLRWAIAGGFPEAIRLLLQHRADPTSFPEQLCRGEKVPTPPLEMERFNRLKREFVGQFNNRHRNGCLPPLTAAINHGCAPCARAIIENGEGLSIVEPAQHRTPLMYSVVHHNEEIQREVTGLLLEAKVDANAVDRNGDTALMLAIRDKAPLEVVTALLEYGADPSIANPLGETASSIARQYKQTTIENILSDSPSVPGVDLLRLGEELRKAAKEGDVSLVTSLLQKKADPLYSTFWGETALGLASRRCHNGVISALLGTGLNPNSLEYRGKTPLMLASEHCRADTLRLLLDAKAGIERKDWRGESAISYAAGAGHVDNIKLLLNYPHQLDSADTEKELERAKLTVSSAKGNLSYLKTVAQGRWDLNYISHHNYTPLIWAASYGQSDAIDVLIKKGAKVNGVNRKGESALMWASSKGQYQAAQTLIRLGADVRSSNESGSTALHWAAWNGKEKLVTLLIQHGAKIDLKNSSGKTAFDLAKKQSFPKVMELLRED
jgi:ankyrin repeat protein